MATAYTDKLRLAKPVTGDLFGTWGDVVNVGITSLLDDAVAGRATVTHDDSASYTLTANNGAADEARCPVIRITGTLTAARNVVCPTQPKSYIMENATTGGFAVTLKTSAGTGVAVAAGAAAMLRCDGTNVIEWIPVTGTGSLVKATSPTLVTPALGTPASGVMTNATGTAVGLTSGITNALKSATTTIDVAAATAPTAGQVLMAASSTVANWQTNVAVSTVALALKSITTNVDVSAATAPSTGQVLMATGASAATWQAVPVGGSDTQIQFNDAGAFGGHANATIDATTGQLVLYVDALINGLTIGLGGGGSGTNAVVGSNGSLASNTTGTENAVFGYGAMQAALTSERCAAFGSIALGLSAAATDNSGFGRGAGYSMTGSYNTAVGADAMVGSGTGAGVGNTAVGANAGLQIDTGDNNLCLGRNSGNDALLTITTQSNNVVLGNNSTTAFYCKTATITTSDARDKTNFGVVPHGLDFVCQLTPARYQFRVSREDDTPAGPVRYGFLAQDVMAVEGPGGVVINDDDPENLKYNESSLIPVLVKAIQELSAEVNALKRAAA